MAFRLVLTVALVASVALGQNNQGSGSSTLPRIPGARTAAEIMAASADGGARYLAPDGPIQPGITAAAGLPVRAAERVNQGITRVSEGLHNQADSLSRAAGDGGQIRMPGLDTLESRMPEPLKQVGEQIQGAIRGKNNFIRQQAEEAHAAMNRLRNGMHGSMSSAQDLLAQGRSSMQGSMEQHMKGATEGLDKVRGLGGDLRNQAQGLGRTVSNGAQRSLSELQRTGQDVVSQLQNNHARNTNQLSNMLGSMRNSMGSNLDGLRSSMQSAAQRVSGSLQSGLHRAAEVPMNLFSSLGKMVNSGMSSGSSAAQGSGRY